MKVPDRMISDRWALEVGDERWSWKGMLPFFKKTETFVPGIEMVQENDSDTHGYSGPITVSWIANGFLIGS